MMVSEKSYTSKQYLLNCYRKKPREMSFAADNEIIYNIWKSILINKLKQITGISNMRPCDLTPQLLEEEKFETYTRQKFIIQTELDVYMPFYILIPNHKTGKLKTVIAPHGHASYGKAGVAGDCNIPEVQEKIDFYHYDYGRKLVEQGYVVFCPDARGAGERMEEITVKSNKENYFASSCNALNFAAMSLGKTLLGMQVWDLMRLVDFIFTLDFCNTDYLSCVGFSGGGLQSLWLSIFDERVRKCASSGYFYSFESAILNTHQCGCNFVPGLWNLVDMGDLATLIAPRKLYIEVGNSDSQIGELGMESVKGQVDITKSAYRLFNKEENFIFHTFDGGHVAKFELLADFLKN